MVIRQKDFPVPYVKTVHTRIRGHALLFPRMSAIGTIKQGEIIGKPDSITNDSCKDIAFYKEILHPKALRTLAAIARFVLQLSLPVFDPINEHPVSRRTE